VPGFAGCFLAIRAPSRRLCGRTRARAPRAWAYPEAHSQPPAPRPRAPPIECPSIHGRRLRRCWQAPPRDACRAAPEAPYRRWTGDVHNAHPGQPPHRGMGPGPHGPQIKPDAQPLPARRPHGRGARPRGSPPPRHRDPGTRRPGHPPGRIVGAPEGSTVLAVRNPQQSRSVAPVGVEPTPPRGPWLSNPSPIPSGRREEATHLHGPTKPTSPLDEKPPGTRSDLQKRPSKASPSRSRIPKRRQKRSPDRSRMRERRQKASWRSSSFLPARPNPFRRRSRMRERRPKRSGERSRTPQRRRERSCRRFRMLKPPPKRFLRDYKTSPACQKRFDSRFDTPETPAQRSRPVQTLAWGAGAGSSAASFLAADRSRLRKNDSTKSRRPGNDARSFP